MYKGAKDSNILVKELNLNLFDCEGHFHIMKVILQSNIKCTK